MGRMKSPPTPSRKGGTECLFWRTAVTTTTPPAAAPNTRRIPAHSDTARRAGAISIRSVPLAGVGRRSISGAGRTDDLLSAATGRTPAHPAGESSLSKRKTPRTQDEASSLPPSHPIPARTGSESYKTHSSPGSSRFPLISGFFLRWSQCCGLESEGGLGVFAMFVFSSFLLLASADWLPSGAVDLPARNGSGNRMPSMQWPRGPWRFGC